MKRWTILCVMILLITPNPARAWHNRGHMAVARIAWQQLVHDGLDRQAIHFLNSHPHRDLFLAADRPEEIDQDEWLFVQAACWSDWVRRPIAPGLDESSAKLISEEFNKPVWHYINLPYVHPAEKGTFDESALRAAILEPEFDDLGNPRHVLAAIKYNLQRIERPESTSQERGVAICWVLHLVGDLHQPLHAVGLIASRGTLPSEEFLPPSGDQGGNRLAIRATADDLAAMPLHTWWDARLMADLPYATVRGRVLGWLNDPKLSRRSFSAALEKKQPLDWADESNALARSAVYVDRGEFLKAQPLPLKYMRTELEGMQAPIVSTEYQTRADAVAQERMLLAGYRLGDALAGALKNTPAK
jgi:S1/P1 Nuclease